MTTDRHDLDPIAPERALELYLSHKATECTEKTVQNHRYRLGHFVRWCGEEGIENLNALGGRDLHSFRLWRKADGDLNKLTLSAQMSTLRVFLKWCASIEAVDPELYDKVMVPRVSAEEEHREETLDADTAAAILDYLSRFHYASVEHAVFAVLWETGVRLGGAHSLDVGDVDFDGLSIQLVHRPEQGTALKNGQAGERPVAITPDLGRVLEDYVENPRVDRADEYGRAPLFTTSQGRMHRSTLRGLVYRVTAPCFRGEPCPDCEQFSEAKCGEAVSPHAVRRGSITHYLTQDVPVEVVSDRMNVSRDVLDKHYDRRSEKVKLEQRREYLGNV